MERETTNSLAAKLALVAKEIGSIGKNGKNRQQGYNYIEYSEIAGKIRELFAKYKIVIAPEIKNALVTEIKNKSGNIGYHYILEMEFTILDGENDKVSITKSWRGESIDYGDKGINKAATSGTKYFLMRLFQVSEKGDDPDAVSPEPGKVKQAESAISVREKIQAAKSAIEVKRIYTQSSPSVKRLVLDDCKKRVAALGGENE